MTLALADVTVRALRRQDGALLGDFFVRNSVPEVTNHFHPFPLTQDTAKELTGQLRRDRYYVAEHSGRIVALSMLRGWDAGYVVPSFGIVVDREWHGQGIGGSLTDFTIEEAQRFGCPSVRLSVYASNVVAHQIYARRGFVEQSREPVEAPFGADYRIVMSKDLAA